MIVRKAKQTDSEQIFKLFRSVSITSEDISQNPKYGFYEYSLSEQDIASRVNASDLSLVFEGAKGIIGYIIAYPCISAGFVAKHNDKADPVHLELRNFNPKTVYLDQLLITPETMGFVAGRLMEVFNYNVRGQGFIGVVAAVPEKPWINVSSTRFALTHGFHREVLLETGNVGLRLMTKPYWELQKEFGRYGDYTLRTV